MPLGGLCEADGGVGIVAEATNGPIRGVFTAAFRPTFGDFDGDGDIGIDDLACFTGCMTGPGVPVTRGCENNNSNPYNEIDMLDCRRIQLDFTGP